MRNGATALASGLSETIVQVVLPDRSYAIVIGEGLIASTGRRRIVTQRAWVAWKIISSRRDAKAIPHQYANATRYE